MNHTALKNIVKENQNLIDFLMRRSLPLDQLCKEGNATEEVVNQLIEVGVIEVVHFGRTPHYRLSAQGSTLPVPREADQIELIQKGWWKRERWNLRGNVVLERLTELRGGEEKPAPECRVDYYVWYQHENNRFYVMDNVFWLLLRVNDEA